MPHPPDRDRTLLLARSFDLAWEQYYRANGEGLLSEEIARPALALFLVEMAKSGIKEECALAAAGILHLVSITMGQQAKK